MFENGRWIPMKMYGIQRIPSLIYLSAPLARRSNPTLGHLSKAAFAFAFAFAACRNGWPSTMHGTVAYSFPSGRYLWLLDV